MLHRGDRRSHHLYAGDRTALEGRRGHPGGQAHELAAIDAGTEVTRILAESGAGVSVAPDDPVAFTDALRAMVNSGSVATEAGARGRLWVESHVSPARVAHSYLDVIASLGV